MNIRFIALLAILSLCLAGTAAAKGNKGGTLTVGGNTIAGPGNVSMGSGITVAVVDGIDEDICTTLVNSSKASSVLLELVGEGTDSVVVAAGATRGFCMDNTDTVQITCQGPDSCSAGWRVDAH